MKSVVSQVNGLDIVRKSLSRNKVLVYNIGDPGDLVCREWVLFNSFVHRAVGYSLGIDIGIFHKPDYRLKFLQNL